MFGSPETTPGGRALKFFCSIRMDIRRIGQIKEANGTVTGSRTRLKVVKNKIAPPFTACEFDIMYNEGISRTGSIVDLGIEHKILVKKGAWISFEGNLVGQGREAAKQAIAEDDALMKTITDAIMEKVEVTVGAVLAQNKEDDSD
jgi:recombination protein RecA